MVCCSGIGLLLQDPLMMIAAAIFAVAASTKQDFAEVIFTLDKLIRRGDVYKLFDANGMAHLHVADIDQIPVVDAVELPCLRPFDNGQYGTAYEVLSWEERLGFMTEAFKKEDDANERLVELSK